MAEFQSNRNRVRDLMHFGWILGNAKQDERITEEEFSLHIDAQAADLLSELAKPRPDSPELRERWH